MFEMDDLPNPEDSEDGSNDSIYIHSNHRLMIFKLDMLLGVVFQHIQFLNSQVEASQDSTQLNNFFHCLLESFDRVMLPTHRLKCVQFLIFYLCSLSPSLFPEEFLGLLVMRLMAVSDSSVIRMYSASYLGSYIARAKYISLPIVDHALKILNQLAHSYLDLYEPDVTAKGRVDVY
jgi:RNA polymerase I-specific transcription initiation factor RRN3